MNKFKCIIGISILAVYLLSTTMVSVKETDFVIISQFGRPVRVVEQAGLTFKLPTPIQTAQTINQQIQLYELGSAEYGTRDRRNVVVNSYIVWQIIDPIQFLTSVRETDIAQPRLEALVNSEIGSAIGSVDVSQIFSDSKEKNQLATLFQTITANTNQIARAELGIKIEAVRPNRFGFPVQNLQAIYNRMESEWDRLARQYRAEGEEAASKIQAETEQEVRKLIARAYRDGQKIRGASEAEAAELYAEAFASAPEYYQFSRMLEAYETIFNDQTQLILPTDSPVFKALLSSPEGDQ